MKTKDEKRKWQLAFCCASSWKKTKNENEEEVLAREKFTSDCRPGLKNART